MLDRIPKPILVAVVLVIGVLSLFLIQEPHSVCTNQIQVFKESQAGFIFPKQIKKSTRPPLFSRMVENCKIGNSPGSCLELFSGMRKMLRDMGASSQECFVKYADVPEVDQALKKSLDLMVRLAWGHRSPDATMEKFGWLESSDLALYCQLKRTVVSVYGEQEYERLRLQIQNKLPGEPEVIEDGVCMNCEVRKTAPQVLTKEDIWVKSLFSLRCDQF